MFHGDYKTRDLIGGKPAYESPSPPPHDPNPTQSKGMRTDLIMCVLDQGRLLTIIARGESNPVRNDSSKKCRNDIETMSMSLNCRFQHRYSVFFDKTVVLKSKSFGDIDIVSTNHFSLGSGI